jgi:hypothetical protein
VFPLWVAQAEPVAALPCEQPLQTLSSQPVLLLLICLPEGQELQSEWLAVGYSVELQLATPVPALLELFSPVTCLLPVTAWQLAEPLVLELDSWYSPTPHASQLPPSL